MVITALAFFYKARKQEQERVVTFAKPRYRNGVEVKPSEAALAAKATGKSAQKEKLIEVEDDEEEVLDKVDIN